ncbi:MULTISPECIES: UvrD-helicase domain-containing protein [Yersinia pseudotuberculosis complex]|uniref:UvrD-helicase domain-containing protein n=1 Tax=Yersinia pseudotuberculosis complex TaxID=1649845 RepID=UPI000349678A|nr:MULTISPECIES: UvrD-helicase domain-containing protein [Yersinia pseudotuberculosis complex]QES99408.1 ATP-dependent helicase [Yersinia pseudotuberculosis]CFU95214.1 DNA-dependent helicase II [Yersinia pseudotuberculosis]CNB81867.1 DNA-dependent helicase II [Yersinia pseudotuberculosis]CNB97696.1 DNA-dependent helicase II [Yersinia pseudotuberculosis]CRY61333.1 DNA-dependent helicase II [Yersinia pseudotuberculosis]
MDTPSANDPIVDQLFSYLNLDNPRSFLLFAGAGSGKTRTLVSVLEQMKQRYSTELSKSGKRIGIITYTNAACEEIQRRLFFDANFMVSTIHSFCWDLINPFTADIKLWLKKELTESIDELTRDIKKSTKPEGVTAQKNRRRLASKKKRLQNLDTIQKFSYSPTSNRPEKGTLNHSEVIKVTACLLQNEALLREILFSRYPVLLIDESQDTNKLLIESLITTQQENPTKFCLGLFGDMMQQIFSGGKSDLASPLPPGWESPEIKINHRSPVRIVTLINTIRQYNDKHTQKPAPDAQPGTARLFVVDMNTDKVRADVERQVAQHMAAHAGDTEWKNKNLVKVLTLEHHMAARRGEFENFLLPLLEVDRLGDAAIKGESQEITFLSSQLWPFIDAIRSDDDFKIANIMRKYSPVFSGSWLESAADPLQVFREAQCQIDKVKALLDGEPTHSILDVCRLTHEGELLILPEALLLQLAQAPQWDDESTKKEDVNEEYDAWGQSLNASTRELENYISYISSTSSYGTHQGVKGLQYPRVMAILDDEEARGFMFSYDKLLGVKPLSKADHDNESTGADSAPKRSRRLFYVICSRAQQSLAVVAYTKAPSAVERAVIASGWFGKEEITHM